MAVIGAREAEAGTVAVRVRGAGRKQDIVSWDHFVEHLKLQVETKTLHVGLDDGALRM